MPEDDALVQDASHGAHNIGKDGVNQGQASAERSTASVGIYDVFRLPEPIKQIFDRFPLKIYPANELPKNARRRRDRHALYVFVDKAGARAGRPSFNPACLKWQAYLRFHGIKHTLVPSTNHASPTGALPFLIPATSSTSHVALSAPISASRLQTWTVSQSPNPDEAPTSVRTEAYSSLLDYRLRAAWLHTLYLRPANFDAVAVRLYISPSTSSPLVREMLVKQLQSAAYQELLKLSPLGTPFVDEQEIYTESRLAFEALSILLGDNQYFSATDRPGLFDASVFAYTYLILDQGPGHVMKWSDKTLNIQLEKLDNLVRFTERIAGQYFPSQ